MEIEYRSVESLIPYVNNARTHNKKQIEQIAASIVEFGFNNPILVDGENGVIAGHGRLLAAKLLKLDEVPVIELKHLSEEKKKMYILADNKIALNSGWDNEILQSELESLRDCDMDLSTIGFSDDELSRLMSYDQSEYSESFREEDDFLETPQVLLNLNSVSKSGEIWILGRHRLACGDATDSTVYEKLLNGAKANLCVTDPPYNVAVQGWNNKQELKNDKMEKSEFYNFLLKSFTNVMENINGPCYVAFSFSEFENFTKAYVAAGGKISDIIIWNKSHITVGRTDYQRKYEPIIYGWKDIGSHYWCGSRSEPNVWDAKKPKVSKDHPTQKPIEIFERAIRNSSQEDDIVLDPFCGSGTTILAAEKSKRSAFCIELDPKYVDVIIRRFQDYTGIQAYRESDGLKFDEIEVDEIPKDEIG